MTDTSRPARDDLDWARGVPLDRVNTITAARLMIRFLREELDRRDELAQLREQAGESS